MKTIENLRTMIAVILYHIGIPYSVSKFIDEDTITAGYGKIDCTGWFQYDLPPRIIRKIFGTTSWRIWGLRNESK